VKTYRYRPEVLEQLARHGVKPLDTTPPALVNEFLNDLYRYEIRKLRRRFVERQFPPREYVPHVIALRRRYPLISVPVRFWTL
jgi:hypothetical protein